MALGASRKDQDAAVKPMNVPRTLLLFGDYEVNVARRELRKRGIRVRLEQKPFRVLELLLRRPGELVSREELIRFLWPDSNVSFERGLNTAVNSLRKALGESFHEPHFIETRSGLGYRFSATVQEVEAEVPRLEPGKGSFATEDCLKGRFFLDRMTEEDTYKGISFFKSALLEDETSSLAHAGLADAYCQLALFRWAKSPDLERQARAAALTALRSDPQLAQAHISAGRVKIIFDWDCNGALEAVGRAMAQDADSVSARILHAAVLVAARRYESALEIARQAVSLDPLSLPANLQLAACLYAARDFKSAVDQCWKMLTLTSQFAPAQILLALAYQQLGMYEEAIVEFENAQRCAGFESTATAGLKHLFVVAGLRSEPKVVTLGLPSPGNDGSVSNYGKALLCAARGEISKAFPLLEESARQRDPAMLWAAADARFDSLRDDERFHAVVSPFSIRS